MPHSPYHRFNSLKLLAYADRLEAIVRGDLPFPIDWHIYPTNFCNQHCSWCMFRQNGEQDTLSQLPADVLLRAVNDAARTDARLIHFSGGGEPLLNVHTLEACQLANELGMSVALSTNGSFLTPEYAKAVDYLRVSLNAGMPETHQLINSGHTTDWKRIIENINYAAKVKRQDIGLSFVVCPENVEDIPVFCRLAVECGVDFVHIRPAFWYDKQQDVAVHAVMERARVLSMRAQAECGDNVDVFAITEKFEGYWTPRTYDRCRANLTGTCLTATGEFALCQDRTDLKYGSGYAQGATFEDIWYSEEHLALKGRMMRKEELDKCPRCVWNKRNEIIQQVFIRDGMRLDLV